MNPQERAAYRAFLREHHPDRGGDPAVFAAGLARLRETQRPHREPDPPPTERPADLPFPVRVAIALVRTVRARRSAATDDTPQP